MSLAEGEVLSVLGRSSTGELGSLDLAGTDVGLSRTRPTAIRWTASALEQGVVLNRNWHVMKKYEYIAPVLLILASIVILGIFGYVSTLRTLTSLELIISQIFALVMGLFGSFIFGRQLATKVSREVIKPHARSAFRRLLSLYAIISRVASIIVMSKDSEDTYVTLEKIEAIVIEQLTTADDALEDWRDIVPEEVDELSRKLRTNRTENQQ